MRIVQIWLTLSSYSCRFRYPRYYVPLRAWASFVGMLMRIDNDGFLSLALKRTRDQSSASVRIFEPLIHYRLNRGARKLYRIQQELVALHRALRETEQTSGDCTTLRTGIRRRLRILNRKLERGIDEHSMTYNLILIYWLASNIWHLMKMTTESAWYLWRNTTLKY